MELGYPLAIGYGSSILNHGCSCVVKPSDHAVPDLRGCGVKLRRSCMCCLSSSLYWSAYTVTALCFCTWICQPAKDSKITDQPAHRSSQNTFGEELPPYSVCVWHLGFGTDQGCRTIHYPHTLCWRLLDYLNLESPRYFLGAETCSHDQSSMFLMFSRICQNCFAFSWTSNSIGTVAPKQCFCHAARTIIFHCLWRIWADRNFNCTDWWWLLPAQSARIP